MIKINKRNVINVSDWDRLVRETYNKPYSFQQQDGCKSRGVETIFTHSDWEEDFEDNNIPEVLNGEDMGVSFKSWLERDREQPLNPSFKEAEDCGYFWGNTEEELESWGKDKSHIDMFWERNFYPHANMIAQDLCKKGLLKEGEYDIKIDW